LKKHIKSNPIKDVDLISASKAKGNGESRTNE